MPPVLVRFSTAAALAYTAYAMCRAPVLPLFARHLGAGPEQIGLIVGASTLAGVVLKLPAGTLSDAIGRRAVLLAACAVIAIVPFVYPICASLGMLAVVRFVHGSGSALFGPTASAWLSDRAPSEARGRWVGIYTAIQGSGQAAGPVIGGWLVASYGYTPAFIAAALTGLVAWALLAGLLERTANRARLRFSSARDAIRQVARDQRIVLTSVAQAGQFVLHGLIAAFLPLYAVERAGMNAAEAGVLFGAQMLTTVASRPMFGRISDRIGRRRMIVAGLSISGVTVALLPAARSFVPLLLLAAVYGAGLAVTTSSSSALITDLSDRARYGAAHGLFGTIFDVGDALGPIAGGFLAAWLGYERTFQIAASAALALAILFARQSRRWAW